VASAGLYANLHTSLQTTTPQHPTTQFFTGRMLFLPPNQQHQGTEGIISLLQHNQNTDFVYDDVLTCDVRSSSGLTSGF